MERKTVLITERAHGERLGRAELRTATDDLTVFEYTLEPGSQPGTPHYHARYTDSFYVLEGELEFQMDGGPVRATAGMLVVAPRGAVHAFPVAIRARAKFLNLHAPGGFEHYMSVLTALRARGEQPDAGVLRAHDIYEV
jgi:quercetin dioxygenase-like cupin family protein